MADRFLLAPHSSGRVSPSNERLAQTETTLAEFSRCLAGGNVLRDLADGLVGNNAEIAGPFGPKPLIYADYVASGRSLMQIERFLLDKVLPYYANSHTEASYCGGLMTRLRREARNTNGHDD